MMDEKPKIGDITPENWKLYMEEMNMENERRLRLNQWWVCTSCGIKMGYDYMELGAFDESGCVSCGHTQAVKVQEDAAVD